MSNWLRSILCWATNHRWDIIAVNVRKNTNLFHLSSMAGCRAICTRCDAEWDDLDGAPFFDDDRIVWHSRHARPLPRATMTPANRERG